MRAPSCPTNPWNSDVKLPGLDDLSIRGRRVLTRIDVNVPVRNGVVTDSTRIKRVAPTIRRILELGGTPVLVSHLGRPNGRVVPELSLEVIVPALSEEIGSPVSFVPGLPGVGSLPTVNSAKDGDVLLLENLRFATGEECNDLEFARELAMLGDVYCNDAFSAAHRAHASTAGVPALLPGCAGDLMPRRNRCPDENAQVSGPPVRRLYRGSEGFDQTRTSPKPGQTGRRGGHRWRDGKYLPVRAGTWGRSLIVRVRNGGFRQRDT